MRMLIEMTMENAAFADGGNGDPSYEAARILRALANRLEGHPHFSPGHSQPLHDANGNEVGMMDIVASEG